MAIKGAKTAHPIIPHKKDLEYFCKAKIVSYFISSISVYSSGSSFCKTLCPKMIKGTQVAKFIGVATALITMPTGRFPPKKWDKIPTTRAVIPGIGKIPP